MFSSLGTCAEGINQSCQLKVTLEDFILKMYFCVCSTPPKTGWFSWNLAQMLISLRRYAKGNSSYTVKVKVTLEMFQPVFSCSLCRSCVHGRMFLKLGSNVYKSETMCRTYGTITPPWSRSNLKVKHLSLYCCASIISLKKCSWNLAQI